LLARVLLTKKNALDDGSLNDCQWAAPTTSFCKPQAFCSSLRSLEGSWTWAKNTEPANQMNSYNLFATMATITIKPIILGSTFVYNSSLSDNRFHQIGSVRFLQPEHCSKVRFSLDDEICRVERLPFGTLRGDLRHPDGEDPDWQTIAQCRHNRLNRFAETLVVLKAFRAWSRVTHQSCVVSSLDKPEEVDAVSVFDNSADIDFEFRWTQPRDAIHYELLSALYEVCDETFKLSSGLRLKPVHISGQLCGVHLANLQAHVRRHIQELVRCQLRSRWLCRRVATATLDDYLDHHN